MSKIFGSFMKTIYSVGNIPIDIKQKRLDPIKAQTKELRKLLKKASCTAFGGIPPTFPCTVFCCARHFLPPVCAVQRRGRKRGGLGKNGFCPAAEA
mgnify:CR=1 FL=1